MGARRDTYSGLPLARLVGSWLFLLVIFEMVGSSLHI